MEGIIGKVVDGGADGIILNPGPAAQFASIYTGRSALILRLTGASTEHNPNFDYHRPIATVEQAVSLGADAVVSACPACQSGLLDAKSKAGSKMEVLDILELLAKAL